MHSIMINRKLFGNFGFFGIFAENVISFYFSVSRFFIRFDYSEENENRNRKAAFFAVFCHKTSVFVTNKVLVFSGLLLYRANNTLPPAFGTRRVGQLSSEIFYFLFFIFL